MWYWKPSSLQVLLLLLPLIFAVFLEQLKILPCKAFSHCSNTNLFMTVYQPVQEDHILIPDDFSQRLKKPHLLPTMLANTS